MFSSATSGPPRSPTPLLGLWAAVAALLGACAAPQASAPPVPVQAASISDGATGGNPHFFWVTNKGLTTFPGRLDTAANPVVKICKVVNNVSTSTCPVAPIAGAGLTLTPDNFTVNPPVFGFWRGRWNTKTPSLSVSDDYRMSVLVGGQVVGYQDVDLVATSGETRTPRPGFIAIVNGASLDFKFRVEVGAGLPNVNLNPSSLSFPTVFVGQASAAKTVTIKNVGVSTLGLTGTALSGAHPGDFVASLSGCDSVAVSATCTLSVTFKPATLGPRTATLILRSSGSDVPQTLALSGGGSTGSLNTPPRLPHAIIAFPVRDFVSASGYGQADRVTVSVLRPDPAAPGRPRLLSQARNVVPQDDPGTPGFDGLVEVNHPGGVCWENIVPDLRAGDIIRLETAPGVGDETLVQNVKVTVSATVRTPASRDAAGNSNADGVIEVHGLATDLLTGKRMDPALFEARLIAKKNQFARNGKRALSAGGAGGKDGTLTFDNLTDPSNSSWTAVFTGLNSTDLQLALGAESRALWLGRDPLAASELTIYEYGQFPGFAGGCAGPVTGFAGPLAAPAPASLTFNEQGLFDPADPTANPPSAPQFVTMTNGGGAALNIADVTLSGPGAGDFLIDTDTCRGTAVPPSGSCTVGVRFRPSSGGPIDAQLNFVDDADNTPQSVGLTGNLNSVTPGPVNEPPVDPHALIVFPSRDFVSAQGYGPQDRVKVEVLRGGTVIGVANNVVPRDDLSTPGFDGLVEVNHPGGACWEGTTPDIRPGDVVRYTTNLGVVDQTTTQTLLIIQPATQGRNPDGTPAPTVIVKGVALDQAGNLMPANQFETRLIARGSTFAVNGRRALRAGGAGGKDGTLTFDAGGPAGSWTAVFSGLSQADIDLATSMETRAVWLGRIPAALTESTVHEFGLLGGPVGCAAPLSVPTLTPAPQALDFGPVALTTSATKTVALTVSGPTDITSLSVAGIDASEFSVNPGSCLGNGRSSCTFSVSFTPGGVGIRTATVQLADSADGSPHAVLLSGQGVAAPPPNRPPVAGDDSASTHAGRPLTLNVLANDTDADGDLLSVTAVDSGASGLATCTADGGCTYTPNPGFSGTTHFAYTVSDGRGGSDSATVTLDFTNAAPRVTGETTRTGPALAVPLNVLTSATDADADPLSLAGFSQGTNGNVACAPDGSCTYTPASGFAGTDTFTYQVTDGFASVTGTVTVLVDPLATANDDGPLTIALSSFDPAAGAFIPAATLLANDLGRALVLTGATSSGGGSATCDAAGCTFRTGNSGPASFTYAVRDAYGNTASAAVALNFTAP